MLACHDSPFATLCGLSDIVLRFLQLIFPCMSENESRGKSESKVKKRKSRKKRMRGGKYLLSERGQIGH